MTMTLDGSGTSTVGVPNRATAQNSTSGTSIDFTGIPAGTKRVTVMFNGVSINGTSGIDVKIGSSGGIESTGYSTGSTRFSAAGSATVAATTAFYINDIATATDILSGSMTIVNISGNIWAASAVLGGGNSGNNLVWLTAGNKTLSGTLDRVRIATTNGTDTFDAGSINILYE